MMSFDRERQVQSEPEPWTCRIHPQFVRDMSGPGQCPICGVGLERRSQLPSEALEAGQQRKRAILWVAMVVGVLSLVVLARCDLLPGVDQLLR